MRVLVTGSSGYIGPHLVRALQAKGHYVVGLDRLPPTHAGPDRFVLGDILDAGLLDDALDGGIDCIAHLAAARADWGLSDEDYERDNVAATERVIAAGQAAGVKNWLAYSTVGVLGSSATPLTDETPRAPDGPYATTKAQAEVLFEQFAASDPGASVTMVRPSAVFGPGNPPNTNVYRLIDAIYRHRFVMIGDGSNVKTTSYLPNLIGATMFMFERMEAGIRSFVYVDSPALTTAQLVDILCGAIGQQPPRWHVPLAVARPLARISDVTANVLKVDLPITSARIQKFCRPTNFAPIALNATGFEAPFTNEEALTATVKWYLETHQ